MQKKPNSGWTYELSKDKQLILHLWHLSCYSSNKAGDKSWNIQWLFGYYYKPMWIIVLLSILSINVSKHLYMDG